MVSPQFLAGVVAVDAEQAFAKPVPQINQNPHWDVLLILAPHYHSLLF